MDNTFLIVDYLLRVNLDKTRPSALGERYVFKLEFVLKLNDKLKLINFTKIENEL